MIIVKNQLVAIEDCGCKVSLHSITVPNTTLKAWFYRFRGEKYTEGKPHYKPAFDYPPNPLVKTLKDLARQLGYKSHFALTHEFIMGLQKAGEIFEGEAGAYVLFIERLQEKGYTVEMHMHDEYKVTNGKHEALIIGEYFSTESKQSADGSPYLGEETTFSIRLPNRGEWNHPSQKEFWK